MSSIPHPPWCAPTETDGIHRSTPIALQHDEVKLTHAAVHRWQLDERRPLTGVGLTFTLGEEQDSQLDMDQAPLRTALTRLTA
jgi:hypothetical protein